MIHFYPDEKWEVLQLDSKVGLKYALSSYGRLVSFTDTISNGNLLKGSQNKGYKLFRYYDYSNEGKVLRSFYIHKLVAEIFLPSKKNDQCYVIHLDYVKDNNRVKNLRWANKQELELHQNNNPKVISDRKRLKEFNRTSPKGYKLTEEKVRILKRKLLTPKLKTRMKMIARQFGVSEMQLYRIKRGENWGHVKID
jgi:hypothetical protein